ncbi:MAG TPA: hypothetical protein VLV78_19085 [Thermoanaerobaculia bacterium]|nr:hypothetical protein [Thermoanaerobaculia bacterium]
MIEAVMQLIWAAVVVLPFAFVLPRTRARLVRMCTLFVLTPIVFVSIACECAFGDQTTTAVRRDSLYARAGPFAVRVRQDEWLDAGRGRRLPVTIYEPVGAPRPLPAVIFSHGLANGRDGYSYLGRHWASHGYLCVHPEHVGAAHEVERAGLVALYRAGNDHRYWEMYPEDLRFVTDHLRTMPGVDSSRVVVAGHSLGAYGVLAVAGLDVEGRSYRDPRVVAGIPISMSEDFEPAAYRAIAIPLLHITGTHDSSIVYGTLPHRRRMPFDSTSAADQYLLTIRGANHSTPSDDESVSNKLAHDLIRAATTAFLDAYLRRDPAAKAWLQGEGLSRFAAADARVERKTEVPRIGKISVNPGSLFSDEEASHGALYQVLNRLHTNTRADLVRSFLLFREGEVYDPVKIAESEKNLRALDFIKTAAISVTPVHDGVVDVRIVTEDEWTSDPNVDFGRDRGVATWNLNFTQKDLGGSGAEVSVSSGRLPERTESSIEFLHPAFLRPYWNGDLLLAKRSDGAETKFSLAQPFYSSSTPFSFEISSDNDSKDIRIFRDGRPLARFHSHGVETRAIAGWALTGGPESAARIFGGFDFVNDQFHGVIGGFTPLPRRYRWTVLGFEIARENLVKVDYVDHDARYDDFDLGSRLSMQAGTSRTANELTARFQSGLRLGERAFLLPRVSFGSRFGPRAENEITSASIKLIWRSDLLSPQTLVSRLQIDEGRRLDRDVQFFADALHGLRGYPAYAFEGHQAVVANVEDRLFLGRELLHLFAPGLALFADAGKAGLSGVKSDFGAGLRMAIPRADSTMLRFDLAYALQNSPISRRGFVVSFATSQAF